MKKIKFQLHKVFYYATDLEFDPVTGSNKGIGYAIVKGLCEKYDGYVYLTSRDVARGHAAIETLKKLGLNPLFHQLDITDQSSVDNFKEHLKTKHGGIDILINNAAIAFKRDSTEPYLVQVRETIRVNFFSTLRICEALIPLLRNDSRVINVSSLAGHLSKIPSEDLRAKFNDKNLDVASLEKLMHKFVQDSEANINEEEGWGNTTPYVVSKVGLSALTNVYQRVFDEEKPNRNISINSVHPGYVDTDMTKHRGNMTIEQGAKAPLFLALEADLKGKYVWFDNRVFDWDGPVPEKWHT